jgi:hypothetical protein
VTPAPPRADFAYKRARRASCCFIRHLSWASGGIPSARCSRMTNALVRQACPKGDRRFVRSTPRRRLARIGSTTTPLAFRIDRSSDFQVPCEPPGQSYQVRGSGNPEKVLLEKRADCWINPVEPSPVVLAERLDKSSNPRREPLGISVGKKGRDYSRPFERIEHLRQVYHGYRSEDSRFSTSAFGSRRHLKTADTFGSTAPRANLWIVSFLHQPIPGPLYPRRRDRVTQRDADRPLVWTKLRNGSSVWASSQAGYSPC